MNIWECEIVDKDGPEYRILKAEGWQPHQFTLIPVPPEARPGGLLSANGQNMAATFVQIVMMRRAFHPDHPFDRDAYKAALEELENAG